MELAGQDGVGDVEGGKTCRKAATTGTDGTLPHRRAGQSAFGHKISRSAAGWAVGRCQAGLGGESTHVGVTPGAPSAIPATANQGNHAPTGSGGIHGMRPLSAERSPSVQCALHSASLAEGISASQRSEEHTSELQSLMRISYAVFCLKKKK